MRESVYVLAVSKHNGGTYRIGAEKYKRELEDWELVEEDTQEQEPQEPEDEASVLEKINNFINTDVNLGDVEDNLDVNEMGYHALRSLGANSGIEIRGNPKKDTLIELYNEANG